MKSGKKEEQTTQAKDKDKQKKTEKKLTPEQFLDTPYGLRLLQRHEMPQIEYTMQPESSYIQDNTCIQETEEQNKQYMKRLARTYIMWIRASPICGNKRNQAYKLLKEVQKAAKAKAAENSKTQMHPEQMLAVDRSIEQTKEDNSQKKSRGSLSTAGFSSLLLDTLSDTTEGVYKDMFDVE